uniref:Uncharacterized protein n=1 Tax=Rhipicephalus zambeziensis TaxID=60191 RepID=A0A224Y8T7_9ACAR
MFTCDTPMDAVSIRVKYSIHAHQHRQKHFYSHCHGKGSCNTICSKLTDLSLSNFKPVEGSLEPCLEVSLYYLQKYYMFTRATLWDTNHKTCYCNRKKKKAVPTSCTAMQGSSM